MITFRDGPAQGAMLDLSRVPLMLRVVQNRRTGKWDALDQPDDEAHPDEEIHIYRLYDGPSMAHISCRTRSRSRWISQAVYAHLETQLHRRATHPDTPAMPDTESLRDNEVWAAWCDANRTVLLNLHPRYSVTDGHLKREKA